MSYQEPIPTLKISPNRITFYNEYPGKRSSSRANISNYIETDKESDSDKKGTANRQHYGTLSKSGSRNLVKACERFVYFLNLSNETKRAKKIKTKKSLKFVTLTLASPQKHTDNELRNKLLNQFLTELRQKHNLTNYIWKAEKQENGNLHFHILIDLWIDKRLIREYWNRIQEKLGYVTRFKEGIEQNGFEFYFEHARKNNKFLSSEKILERWKKGQRENWKQPPGTEIKQVEKVKNASAYFAKYFGKEDFIESGFGRIWFASRNISRFPVMRVQGEKQMVDFENYLYSRFKARAYICEYAISWKFDLISLNALFPTHFVGEYICRCLEWSTNFD